MFTMDVKQQCSNNNNGQELTYEKSKHVSAIFDIIGYIEIPVFGISESTVDQPDLQAFRPNSKYSRTSMARTPLGP